MSFGKRIGARLTRWSLGVGFLGAMFLVARLNDPASGPSRMVATVVNIVTSPWFVGALISAPALLLAVVLLRSRRGLGFLYPRLHRKLGMASRFQLLRRGSLWEAWRKAPAVRPRSIGLAPWWVRLMVSPHEYAARLGRAGWVRIWSSLENATIRIAPPRAGKTGELATHVADAPGACVAASTRPDLLRLSIQSRMARDAPVAIFNPENVGGVASTLRWSPVFGGCESYATAVEQAGALMAGAPGSAGIGDGGDRGWWTSQAVGYLAMYLHAAALGDRSMMDVLRWTSHDPADSRREVEELLTFSASSTSTLSTLAKLCEMNDRTRTSTTASITPALEWLNDPQAALAALCSREEQFDVEELLNLGGTLYLIGADRPHGTIAPLFTAFVTHLHRRATELAAYGTGGRLDPPLSLVLDEAPQLVPVPLEKWTATSGGSGIVIHIGAQSKAQLFQKWGETGGQIIWNNCTTKLLFGGTDDPAYNREISELVGSAKVLTSSESESRTGRSRTTSTRNEVVLTVSEVRELPEWHAILLKRYMPATVIKVQPIWRRRDLKRRVRSYERKLRRPAGPATPSAPPSWRRPAAAAGWARAAVMGLFARGGAPVKQPRVSVDK